MRFIFKGISLIFISLFVACSNKKSESTDKDSSNARKVELDSANSRRVRQIASDRNALVVWFKHKQFTNDFQDSLTGQLISFEGIIRDIIRRDSNSYIIQLISLYHSSVIAELIISNDQYGSIKANLPKDRSFVKGVYIVKVEKISSLYPQLKTEVEYYDEENGDGEAFIDYDLDNRLTRFRGQLDTFYIYQYPPEED